MADLKELCFTLTHREWSIPDTHLHLFNELLPFTMFDVSSNSDK